MELGLRHLKPLCLSAFFLGLAGHASPSFAAGDDDLIEVQAKGHAPSVPISVQRRRDPRSEASHAPLRYNPEQDCYIFVGENDEEPQTAFVSPSYFEDAIRMPDELKGTEMPDSHSFPSISLSDIPETIEGSQRVVETRSYPWSAQGRLIMENEDMLRVGSGALIGPNLVLTAAHNILTHRVGNKLPRVITFYAGLNHEGAMEEARIVDYCLPPEWYHAERVNLDRLQRGEPTASLKQQDYAVLLLDRPIGETVGYFGVGTVSKKKFAAATVNLTGYPAAHAYGRLMYVGSGAITEFTDSLLAYDIATYGGQSGGILWLSDGEYPCCVGVHGYGAAGGIDDNHGIPLTLERTRQIEDWKIMLTGSKGAKLSSLFRGRAFPYVSHQRGAAMKVAPTQEGFVPPGLPSTYAHDEVNTSFYPWRCFGQIRVTHSDTKVYIASGVLIGESLVLTASYVLPHEIPEADMSAEIEFYPGRNGAEVPWTVQGIRYYVLTPPEGPSDEGAEKYGCGLIWLNEPIGKRLGHLGYVPAQHQLCLEDNVNLTGYPLWGTARDEGNVYGESHSEGMSMFTLRGRVIKIQGTRIFYDVPTTGAAGGAPFWTKTAGGEYVCLGIHIGSKAPQLDIADQGWKVGTALSYDMIMAIKDFERECSGKNDPSDYGY